MSKPKLRDKTAIIWQGDGEDEVKKLDLRRITYGSLQVRQRHEIARHQMRRPRGDLYADDSEAAVVMLACTRIGAIHSVVFGGFSADSLSRPYH